MINYTIVYKSNTGFTKDYAIMLGNKLGVAVLDIKEAKKKLEPNSNIVYLGWVFASIISGYKQAKKRYNIIALAACGMSFNSLENIKQLMEVNKFSEQFFYIQGGLNKDKLKGFKRLMINMVEGVTVKKVNSKKHDEVTPADLEMLEMFKNGSKKINEDNLNNILNYLKTL